jgi:hypothetical protein
MNNGGHVEMKFTIEVLIIFAANLIALIGGLIHVTNKITEIHTDIKWIKANCPRCTYFKEDKKDA